MRIWNSALALAVVCSLFTSVAAQADPLPTLDIADWETLPGAASVVRFHLHFVNHDPVLPSTSSTGDLRSQMYGAFAPDYGLLGTFNVPPLQPNSFFDVFVDVPLSELPRTSESITGGTAPRDNDCLPSDHWDGNIDIHWMSMSGQTAQANYHIGDIKVTPGAGASLIHMIVGCAGTASWTAAFPCAGWTVSLVNEDLTPAPAVLPPLWTGYIRVTAGPSIPVGSTCCGSYTFTCGPESAVVQLCATACEWATPASPSTWGTIKSLYR